MAVFARLVLREEVRPVVWVALVLSLAGLGLVAQVWQDTRLDPLGVAAGLGGAACLATFLLLGRHSGGSQDPVAVNFWMFAWATAFWLVVEPLWGIDWAPLGTSTSLLGALDGVQVPVWLAVGLGRSPSARSRRTPSTSPPSGTSRPPRSGPWACSSRSWPRAWRGCGWSRR